MNHEWLNHYRWFRCALLCRNRNCNSSVFYVLSCVWGSISLKRCFSDHTGAAQTRAVAFTDPKGCMVETDLLRKPLLMLMLSSQACCLDVGDLLIDILSCCAVHSRTTIPPAPISIYSLYVGRATCEPLGYSPVTKAGVTSFLITQGTCPSWVTLTHYTVLLHRATEAMSTHSAGLAAWRDPQGLRWESLEILQFVVDANFVDTAMEAAQRPVCTLA